MVLQKTQPRTEWQTDYDVIVVGGAAAGLTAALYCSRRTLKTLVITKALGGQLAMTPSVENYPGIKKIGGIELMMQFLAHAQEYGAEVAYETVTDIHKDGDTFTVATSMGNRTAKAVILAFGLTPKNLNVPGEQELQGKGVTYCATCDAPLYKNKPTAVVGGTYEALDAALLLAKIGSQVTLVHAKEGYPNYPRLFQQVKDNKNIQLRMNATVKSVNGTNAVVSITIVPATGVTSAAEETIPVQGVFVENGHKIESQWLGDLVEYGRGNSIVVNDINETKTPGLFAAGDVTPLRDKQVVISAGHGATAALTAYAYIQKKSGKPASRVDWDHTEEV